MAAERGWESATECFWRGIRTCELHCSYDYGISARLWASGGILGADFKDTGLDLQRNKLHHSYGYGLGLVARLEQAEETHIGMAA